MPKYKTIKSVAHNLGHSFLSDMNFVSHGGRIVAYIPEEIYWTAKKAGHADVTLDFISGAVFPPAVATENVTGAVRAYARSLPDLLRRQKSSPDMVREARMHLHFDFAHPSRSQSMPELELPSVHASVEFVDDRGRKHVARPTNWCRD